MTQPVRRSRTPWILAAVAVAGLGLAACGVFVVVYLLSGPLPVNGPPVTITACDHQGDETRIGYKVTNDGTEARTWKLRFRVLDAAGAEISTGTDYTGKLDPGETSDNAVHLAHVGRTGASCEYRGED